MDGERDEASVIDGIRDSLEAAVERLRSANVRDEAVAIFVQPRRVLVLKRQARFIPIGRAWRLGVFLLDREGTLYEVGSTTRAVAPGYPGFQSHSAEERRGYRAAAYRGPFMPGETVNFGATIIALDADSLRSSHGPLFLHNGEALVRWNASAAADTAMRFDAYLNERVGFLIEPPEGA